MPGQRVAHVHGPRLDSIMAWMQCDSVACAPASAVKCGGRMIGSIEGILADENIFQPAGRTLSSASNVDP